MVKKMKCPFCPKSIPNVGIGRDSHIRRSHGEETYQEWLKHNHAEAAPALRSAQPVPATNGNGKGVDLPSIAIDTSKGTCRCPHCSGLLLILPAVISLGKVNAEIVDTPGMELRNRA